MKNDWYLYKNKKQYIKLHIFCQSNIIQNINDTLEIEKIKKSSKESGKMQLCFYFGGDQIRWINNLNVDLIGLKNGCQYKINQGLIGQPSWVYQRICDSIKYGIKDFDLYYRNKSYPESIEMTSTQKEIFRCDTFLLNINIIFVESEKKRTINYKDTLYKKTFIEKSYGHS